MIGKVLAWVFGWPILSVIYYWCLVLLFGSFVALVMWDPSIYSHLKFWASPGYDWLFRAFCWILGLISAGAFVKMTTDEDTPT